MSSSAAEAYVALSECHAWAAASQPAGPGPLLSWAEWTSGGKAPHGTTGTENRSDRHREKFPMYRKLFCDS